MAPTKADKTKWLKQRNRAKERKIVFNLTFEEWWDWWQATGHYHERGCKLGQYCMSRIGDTGPYELGNIFCQLHSQNVIEATSGKPNPFTQEHKDNISKAAKDLKETCVHCGKTFQALNYRRWHGDNCKHNPTKASQVQASK
jgi:hypothetical protein